MPSPSPYLETSLARWTDRGVLARRDAQILLDGVDMKGQFLEGLRSKILQHRQEDLTQLRDARQESAIQWDERLKRLEFWKASSTELSEASKRIRAWQFRSKWFDRAQSALTRYSASLERKAAALEGKLEPLTQSTKAWSDALILKESELAGLLRQTAAKPEDAFLTSAKKRAFLDYVYAAREKEGELARNFKALRAQANLALDRMERIEKSISQRKDADAAYFEIRKNQALESWRPFQKRFVRIRETVLQQALLFEEGRTRLRSLYDGLQKIRVVQEEAAQRRPLLERLFNSRDN